MSEIINTYLLSDPDTMIPMDRDAFYAEQIDVFKEAGKPTRANEVVNILIFNTSGELLIQKRSFNKETNPGLLDKSVGGHIKHGDTPDYTVMVETVQELLTPSIVLHSQGDFDKTNALLHDYLETIAVIKAHTTDIIEPGRLIKDEQVTIANKAHLYFGLYNGKIRPVDREAKGVLWYTLEELNSEIGLHPNTFTEDLRFLMDKYGKDIRRFVEKVAVDRQTRDVKINRNKSF